jgi:hypothetical protein
MAETKTRILWGVNSDTQNIAALPASPFLIPAILLYGTLWIISKILRIGEEKPRPVPVNINWDEYWQNKVESDRICNKIKSRQELTPEDIYRLTIIAQPSWADPRDWWVY